MDAYICPYLADNRCTESWVEVSSRPSSSSLSSAGGDIVTDGLRVQHDSNLYRRRRLRRGQGSATTSRHGTTGSSQEEYEESESESDRVMTSSNEAIGPSPLQNEWRPASGQFTLSSASSDNAYGSEDDENATAIGVRREGNSFTPQPNAFSHPPTTTSARGQDNSMNSYFAQRPSRPAVQRTSYSREQHSPYNMISPSYQADHDAALRASLSTLLSCAAAARGLPKPNRTATETRAPAVASNRVDPSTVGFVPASAIYGQPRRDESQHEMGSAIPNDKSKRKATPATAQRSSSKDHRATKKARKMSNWTPATMDEISPTLLTWFVGAGVVVLVSALSFSAGYVAGREAGHAEALEFGPEAGRCGKEAMVAGAGRGLRRLRWTDAASSIRV